MNNRQRVIFFLAVVLHLTVYSQTKKNNMNSKGNSKTSKFQHTSKEIDNKFYSLAADLSALGQGANILHFDKACVLIGKESLPYILNSSIEFDPATLPIGLQEKIYDVQSISISLPFEHEENDTRSNQPIPKWLYSFRDVKYLTLDHLLLDAAFFDSDLSITHLVLVGIKATERELLIGRLAELQSLKYLIHSGFLTVDDVSILERNFPGLTVLTEDEFDKQVERGEIKLPD
jgi:hypothetical protein